ncbi:MAG TPA: transcription-repair coupling factor, partial [Chthoniobacteraceae bacterium]|nr:transcription-repair coupling factor [Chthoniobacteraceae bacterium]
MKSKPDLLAEIAAAPPMAAKLAAVRAGGAASFEHVVEAAQPFLAALLAREALERVWLVCADVRAQETFHNELLQFFPEALFFPELDRAPVEGALPDPESVAERLGIVEKLATAKGRQLVVLTRASLDDEVPSPAALRQLEV